jgi:prepilin-type N-terminal cleavage/methylation domain-containing protein/prepilin-type processing-associated H-X9-DG protein
MAISSRRRSGFTLVELLVVITIIGMLVALLLPAVHSVRERGRQTQCMNNLKQLSLAAVAYDSAKGNLPGMTQFVKRGNAEYANVAYVAPKWVVRSQMGVTTPAGLSNVYGLSWATVLLPRLERNDIWDSIVQPPTPQGEVPMPPIAVFTCPSDTDALSSPDTLALTYSVNSGGWDPRNSSGDLNITAPKGDTSDNGVFADQAGYERAGAKGPIARMGAIKDGAGTTIMMAENIHKTYLDTSNNPVFSWLTGSKAGVEQQLGMVWVVPPAGKTAPLPGDTINDQERIGGNSAGVADFRADIPRFARPASAHGSGANIAFCDGHNQYLRDDIDYVVYVQLMTPNGRKLVDPDNHNNNAPPISTFRAAPPLAEKDYN